MAGYVLKKGPDRGRVPSHLVDRVTEQSIDELLANWGERIRKARESRGMSQGALAEALGVRQPAVSHWEQGRREPSIWYKLALADVLAVSRLGNCLVGLSSGHELPS